MPYGKWATVKEAARHYRVSRQRIHQLMADGSLGKCKKINSLGNDFWLIPYPFTRATKQIGRPRKEAIEE